MQLKIKRSQKHALAGQCFMLDARVEFRKEERGNVQRYGLGNQVIYNSEGVKKHVARGDAVMDGSILGSFRAIASYALASMKLRITVNGLEKGKHIECKSLEEVIGAEQALRQACENLRVYLDAAAKFDGTEIVIDYDHAAAS